MTTFISLGLSSNAARLRQEAVEYLEARIEGYKPAPASLEVILLEAIAQMVSAIYVAAGEVPLAIFQRFGEELLGIPYSGGSAATIELTFESYEAAPTEGYTIRAETYVNVGGFGFKTLSVATIEYGQTSVAVKAIAVEAGEEYNSLSGEAELITALAYIKAVTVSLASTGGSEPETDEEYVEKLRTALTLLAPRPITALDYTNFVLSADLPSGVNAKELIKVARAVSIDGYKPGTTELEGKIESGSLSTIKEVTSFTGITVGTELSGLTIAPGTTVVSFNEGAKTITMSAKASGEHTKGKIKAIGTYGNERCVTTWVLGPEGATVVTANLEAIETFIKGGTILGTAYPERREQNFLFYCEAPQETAVSVSYAAKMLPGFTEATTREEVAKGLERLLDPETWGTLNAYQSTIPWLNDTTVHYNKVLGVIQAAAGIDYVTELKIGTSVAPTPASADVVLVGPTPLPSKLFSQTVTGEVTEGSEVVKGLPASALRTVGMYVSGEGIPAGTYIVEVKSETELKLSAKATGTHSKDSLTIANVLGALEPETYA